MDAISSGLPEVSVGKDSNSRTQCESSIDIYMSGEVKRSEVGFGNAENRY